MLTTGESRLGAERLLDAEQLIVLGETLRAARRARLDLADAEADDEVGDERVLGLAAAVRHHDGPAGLARVGWRR
jgi:hypothetical protein